jgi:hypothetical protein
MFLKRLEGHIRRVEFWESRLITTGVPALRVKTGKVQHEHMRSALRFKPDIREQAMSRQLSATSGCEQSQQTNSLFDHLVCTGEDRRRHFEAEARHLVGEREQVGGNRRAREKVSECCNPSRGRPIASVGHRRRRGRPAVPRLAPMPREHLCKIDHYSAL